MNKKIIVGINETSANDNICLLPPRFSYESYSGEIIDVIITKEINVEVACNKYISNVDLVFDFGTDPNNLFSTAFKNNYIPLLRNSKADQATMLQRLVDETKAKLTIPSTSCVPYEIKNSLRHSNQKNMPSFDCENICEYDTLFVLKKEYGACGANQVLLPKNRIEEFIHLANKQYSVDKIKSYLPDVKLSYHFDSQKAFGEGNWLIQRYYNVSAEWRILVLDKNIYITKRKIVNDSDEETQKEYKENNLFKQRVAPKNSIFESQYFRKADNAYSDTDYSFYTSFQESSYPFLEDLVKIISKMDFRMGSFDIFEYNQYLGGRLENQVKKYGIFEYCHQFGFSGYDLSMVVSGVKNVVCSYVEDYLKRQK